VLPLYHTEGFVVIGAKIASAQTITSAVVEMMIPSVAFERSRRNGSRGSWPMTNCRSLSIAAKSDRASSAWCNASGYCFYMRTL
jgi:hypothetical protein